MIFVGLLKSILFSWITVCLSVNCSSVKKEKLHENGSLEQRKKVKANLERISFETITKYKEKVNKVKVPIVIDGDEKALKLLKKFSTKTV